MREPAGRWLRVSTGGQDEANQVPDVDGWCSGHEYDVTKTYTLHGKSASKGKQDKALDEVIADMRAGVIRVLVVWHSSRIERRGAYNAFDLARRVRDAGGRIEYVSEPHLNETNDMSDVLLALAASGNKKTSQDISKNVGISFNRIKSNNGVTGRPVYGFTSIGEKYSRTLVQVPAEADVIREAARRYLAGETIDAICDDFNARHIPSPTFKGQPGKHWHAKTLAGLLRSESIAGRRKQGNMVHRYEGIVTWQDHLSLVARLDSRAHRKGISPANVRLLTSLLSCDCGRPMNGITTGGENNRHPAYYCRSGKGGCKMLVDVDDADSQARQQFLEVMGHHQYRIWEAHRGPNHQDEIDQLRQDRNGLDDMADDYLARMTAITAEIKRLTELDKETAPMVMVPVETGQTIAQRFRRLDTVAQRQDMIDAGVSFIATRDDAGDVRLAIDTTSEKTQAYIHKLNLKAA